MVKRVARTFERFAIEYHGEVGRQSFIVCLTTRAFIKMRHVIHNLSDCLADVGVGCAALEDLQIQTLRGNIDSIEQQRYGEGASHPRYQTDLLKVLLLKTFQHRDLELQRELHFKVAFQEIVCLSR